MSIQTTDGEVMAVPQMAFNRIPFSPFTLLIHIEDPLKRAFYAIETMRGQLKHLAEVQPCAEQSAEGGSGQRHGYGRAF